MTLITTFLLYAVYFFLSDNALVPNGMAIGPYRNSTIPNALSDEPFVWSSLGNSWTSEVSYGLLKHTDDEDTKDGCMRNKQAYSVQISGDNSWVPRSRPQYFHFPACSSMRIDQIDDEFNQVQLQLNKLPSNIDMMTLQVGGDKANFAAVANACIFTPEGSNSGAAYPDPNGNCSLEIQKADNYINGMGKSQLRQDVRDIVNRIFDNPHTQKNPDFRLFVPGYFQFFFADGGAGDWCDDMNELVQGLNDGLKAGIAASSHSNRATFIDVDSHIGDHRFCQPGHSLWDQYFGDKVYLWNMSPNGVMFAENIKGANGTHGVREPTSKEFDHWQKTGTFTDDPREIQVNMSAIANKAFSWKNGAAPSNDTQWLNEIDPYQVNWQGLALRPFHPKEIGYTVMAKAIIAVLDQSYNVKPLTTTLGNTQEVKYENSIQILFCEYETVFSWYVFKGPFGKGVDPCSPGDFHAVLEAVTDSRDREHTALMTPPPIPSNSRWDVKIKELFEWESCYIQGSDSGHGSLKCGDPAWLDYPITTDNQYNSVILRCKKGHYLGRNFHRAWVVEWSE